MDANGGGLRPAPAPRHYRRRATVEALQWTGDDLAAVSGWLTNCTLAVSPADELAITEPVFGGYIARPGNWIVRSPSGRIHICQPGLFEEVHELALADPPDTPEANMAAGLAAARAASNYWKKMAQGLAAKLGAELPQPPPESPSSSKDI